VMVRSDGLSFRPVANSSAMARGEAPALSFSCVQAQSRSDWEQSSGVLTELQFSSLRGFSLSACGGKYLKSAGPRISPSCRTRDIGKGGLYLLLKKQGTRKTREMSIAAGSAPNVVTKLRCIPSAGSGAMSDRFQITCDLPRDV
jgi:hypothetical protein